MATRKVLGLTILVLMTACGPAVVSPGAAPPAAPQPEAVITEVEALATVIAADLQARGPLAWMDHFEDGPDFFMASDGAIAFADIEAARSFLDDFAPTITEIRLQWSDLNVSVLASDLATLAGAYTETMRDVDGVDRRFEGYLTATAVRAAGGWKLRNLHWSSPRPPETMQ